LRLAEKRSLPEDQRLWQLHATYCRNRFFQLSLNHQLCFHIAQTLKIDSKGTLMSVECSIPVLPSVYRRESSNKPVRIWFTIAAALILGVTALRAEKVPDIQPGFALPDMHRLTDTVYVAQLSPGLWVHTTVGTLADGSLYAANGALVEDGDTSILFDVGWTPEEARTLLDWARLVLKHPVSKAYVTHFHNDRLGGAAELERQHIPVFATVLTVELAKKTGQPVPDNPISAPVKPTSVGHDAILLFPGAGHTRDNIVVDFPEEQILFGGCFLKAGDAKGIGNLADADVTAWPQSLKHMQSIFPQVKLAIPGHGPISANAVGRTLELLK
jgi:metallo-beta-lactamase class B